jgi:hypothetical protein
MDRIRALPSKFSSFSLSSSTPGAKLSKAFHFNKEHNVMQTSNGQRDPFRDGSELEENSLSRIHLMIHCAAVSAAIPCPSLRIADP